MNRRDFLKSGGTLLASTAIDPDAVARAAERGAAPARGRLIIPLNRDWRFGRNRTDAATARAFDDAQFETVTLPHANVRLPWHGFDERSYAFVSIYRRHFTLPAEARGRRVFVDFDGAMTASTVWINGQRLGEYKGGYTPFSFELTPAIDWERDNVLAVELDSSERADIPPFGGSIDYLTFGGIYRDVSLRIVPAGYIENVFVQPRDAMADRPSVGVACFVADADRLAGPIAVEAELRDGDRVLATASVTARGGGAAPIRRVDLALTGFGRPDRWELSRPRLYAVVVRLRSGNTVLDEDRRRFGFREATFTDHGFELNGVVVKLRGLDRHQTFPFVGQAMPARVQRRDAEILKRELKCNIVRTSHYPQSPHFLDACDELGLLVLEEVPGWQHIGDAAWQELTVDNVRRMIRRDWNHPSIVLWGVRINESRDNHDLYTKTNEVAHGLDPTRQTCGIRYNYESELLEDVFTMNDFGFPLRPPNHSRYLNTEFIGHTYPTKPYDTSERLTEHALRHARVHDQLASNPQYAGGLGWCAFDYDTHGNFGSGDRVCYHGVSDIFRLPKPAAFVYASQCEPAEEIVLEPAFQWSNRGDYTNAFSPGVVLSNCDHLKFFAGEWTAEADPDREHFAHLKHPPFQVDLKRAPWADLRIEGYVGGVKVVEKQYSSRGTDQQFEMKADDATLVADGADATRIVFRVTDEFGNLRRWSTAAVAFNVEGPGELVGDTPFSLVAGCGAVWLRARHEPGTVTVRAVHPVLGARTVTIAVAAALEGGR